MMSFIPVREVWDVVQNVAVKDKRIAELEAEVEQWRLSRDGVMSNLESIDLKLTELQQGYAVLAAERDEWKATAGHEADGLESWKKEAEKLTTTNTVYREALEDWLNFSIDVYTSDFPGMEWLINLKKKTSELIAQDAIERGKQ